MIRTIAGLLVVAAVTLVGTTDLFSMAVPAPGAPPLPLPPADITAPPSPPALIPPAGPNPQVFTLALGAVACATARGVVTDPDTLTVIDYSRPSTEPRLWVIDLDSGQLLYEELVAHGQGTGGNLARQFSNAPDSHQSSLGLFVTAEPYVGRNGYSLRLDGLEPGVNDRARERAIVMHGAPYVSADVARAQGRLGRSWGCPALSRSAARDVIDRIRDGELIFAYYPDADWLASSSFLGGCGGGASRDS